MGKAIRGITVEIGGDTTKLGKALEGSERKAKNLQTELKGVNTLLKMDPGNVTLLTQKQELLTQAVAETKSKLDTLKTAEAQVQAQFEKGEITEEQYRDLQREIVLTEQKLKNLNDELDNFGSVGAQKVAQVGEKVQDVGGKVETFGKGFSVVSAGTGAILGASIVAFKELDSGYDTIITKTGATGDALEGLNTIADNIFGSMPVDMDTVGVAVGEINTRFGYTGEKLEGLSRQFIQFAEINGVDLNNSIGTVDKILEQFNLTGEDAGGVLDLITAKAQQTGIGADTLMKLIQENGSTFKDMGIGVNEAVVLLSQFEANGVNVEVALKGLKKATTEYAEEGLSMEEGLAKTIDSIKNAKTETDALAIAQEIFGTKGANEMSKAIREGRISVEDLSTALGEYGGTVEGTFEGTLDPIDQGTVAMNNLKLAGSELGGVLQSTFAPMLTTIVEKLKSLVTWFSNLSPGIQKIIVIILSVVTAMGPLIIIIGKLISSVGTIMTFAPKLVTAFNGIKTAFSALGTAFTANPIGIIVVAITALIAIFVLLWNKCDGFRNFWINLWESIKNAFFVVVNWIKENWQTMLLFLMNPLAGVFKYCYDHFEGFRTFVNNILTSIKDFFVNTWENIKNAFFAVVNWIKENWQAMLLFIINPLAGVFKYCYDHFEGFRNVVNTVVTSVKNFFVNLWTSIKNGCLSAINWIRGKWTEAVSAVRSIVDTWKTVFSNVWSSIKNTFSSVKTWFASTFSSAWTAVKNVFSGWGAFFGGLWNQIKTKFSSLGSNISSAIGGAVKSGINGIISMIEKTINKAIGLINGAIDLANKLPGVNVGHVRTISFPRLARGGIVDSPTIAQIGEDGREAIIPLENNTEWINNVAKKINDFNVNPAVSDGADLADKLDRIYDRLGRLQMVVNSKALVGEIIDDIDGALADKQLLNARGV